MKKQVAFGSASIRKRSTVQNANQRLPLDNCQVGLQDLDEAVLGLILAHLDVTSICALACTCKDLSEAVLEPQNMWRLKLIESLPYAPLFLPQKAKRGHKWSDVLKHVVVSLKGPSDKLVKEAVTDTARPIVGGAPPRVACEQTPITGVGQSHYYRSTATAKNLFYAEPDISQNPMLAWNHRAQVQDAFLLSHVDERAAPSRQRAAGNACGAACVRSAFPFSHFGTSVVGVPAIRYMEIDITNLGSRGKIAVGVVHGKQAMQWMRSGSHLGLDSGPWEDSHETVGWHVHSGVIYPDKADVRWHSRGAEFAPPAAAPAVLGCGMDIVGNTLFYTLNGVVVGSVLPSGRERNDPRAQDQNGLDDEYDDHDLEEAPSHAQERFLESLMSLRRSDRFLSTDLNLEETPDLLSAFSSRGEEEAATAVRKRSSLVAIPDASGSVKEHAVHPIDVAHCIFAVSLSGGAAVSLNLGQRKFQFDLGGLFASVAADMSRSGSIGGALSLAGSVAGSVASQGLNQRSLAGSLSVVNWRVSVGGRSARSQRSTGGASVFGGANERGVYDRDVDFGRPSNAGSAETFVSCRTRITRAGEGNFNDFADADADADAEESGLQTLSNTELGIGVQDSNTPSPGASYLDRQFWRVLSINDGSELHDAVAGVEGVATQEAEVESVGILKWLGFA